MIKTDKCLSGTYANRDHVSLWLLFVVAIVSGCSSISSTLEEDCLTASMFRRESSAVHVQLTNRCDQVIELSLNWKEIREDTILISGMYWYRDTIGVDLSESATVWQTSAPRWMVKIQIPNGTTHTRQLAPGRSLWLKLCNNVWLKPRGDQLYLILVTDENKVSMLPLIGDDELPARR